MSCEVSGLHHLDRSPSARVTLFEVELVVLLFDALVAELFPDGRNAGSDRDARLVASEQDGRNGGDLLVGRDRNWPDPAQDVVGESGDRPAREEGEVVDCGRGSRRKKSANVFERCQGHPRANSLRSAARGTFCPTAPAKPTTLIAMPAMYAA